MRFERVLKEAVAKYQPIIEEISGTKIGYVIVEPFLCKKSIRENVRIGLSLIFTGLDGVTLGMAQPAKLIGKPESRIKYNPHLAMNLIPGRLIEYLAAHELAHLAHLNGRSLEEISVVSRDNSEKVADYMAVEALGSPNIPFIKDRTYEAQGFMSGTLERLGKNFKEALQEL